MIDGSKLLRPERYPQSIIGRERAVIDYKLAGPWMRAEFFWRTSAEGNHHDPVPAYLFEDGTWAFAERVEVRI